MKFKVLILFLILALGVQKNYAQKFGYIDTEFITSKMPEYKTAQSEIETLTQSWIKDISDKNEEIEQLAKSLRMEESLLTDDMKQERQKKINDKEKEARDLQNKAFGLNGELVKKKQELMKPILDQIAKALEKVVRDKKIDFIFDKSSESISMLYTNPRHDYTDYIMEELGISADQLKEKNKSNTTEEKSSSDN
ncbi:MAG: OmpH family outer membrane protein [Pseudarcicella sp.]|nr:OmpH family outer membrane protein [Pseudarcicella sp.]MBP6409548.1 OmpH family outer membrane protein [Pseudarcicella sp.]